MLAPLLARSPSTRGTRLAGLLTTVLAGAALAAHAGAQTTWYVDLAATPPGDGSPESPYASIQHALSQTTTVHGDTVRVAPGEYFETLDFLFKQVTVKSTHGPLATLLSPASPADPHTVELGSDAEVFPGMSVLEGFTIRRTDASGTGVRVFKGAAGRLVECIVTGHATGCRNDYDLFFERCTITANSVGISGSSLGIHYLESTICRGNGSNFQFAIFGPCYGATWSNLGGPIPPACVDTHDNFFGDSLFWDAANGDFHLRPGSPCIDTGDPSELDPDGSRRDVGALPYDPSWAPGTEAFCFASDAACPCGNGGSGAGGCDLPQATGGVAIAIADFDPDFTGGGSASIVGSGYPPAAQPGVTLIRGPLVEDPPAVFGDGLRCIAASGLVRIGAVLAQGGTSLHAISHGAGAGTFHYQLWTRSTPSTFCDPSAAFNLSNGLSITWP